MKLFQLKSSAALVASLGVLALGGGASFAHGMTAVTPQFRAASIIRTMNDGGTCGGQPGQPGQNTKSSCPFNLTGFSIQYLGTHTYTTQNNHTRTYYEVEAQVSVVENYAAKGANTVYFPATVPLQVTNTTNPKNSGFTAVFGTVNSNGHPKEFQQASLYSSPDPRITWSQGGQNTATADYVFYVKASSQNQISDSYQVEIPPSTQHRYDSKNPGLFDMTISSTGGDSSQPFGNDNLIVCDPEQVGTLNVGQLPEAPWAAGLPLIGLGIVGLVWLGKKRRAGRVAV